MRTGAFQSVFSSKVLGTVLACIILLQNPLFAGRAPSIPFANNSEEDFDGDGLSNGDEARVIPVPSNAFLKHSDFDGIVDGLDAVPTFTEMTVPAAQEARYVLIDLGNANESNASSYMDALGLNDRGEVLLTVGWGGPSGTAGYLWRNGTLNSIGGWQDFRGLLQDGSVICTEVPDPHANLWRRNALGGLTKIGLTWQGYTNYLEVPPSEPTPEWASLPSAFLDAGALAALLAQRTLVANFIEPFRHMGYIGGTSYSGAYLTGINDSGMLMFNGDASKGSGSGWAAELYQANAAISGWKGVDGIMRVVAASNVASRYGDSEEVSLPRAMEIGGRLASNVRVNDDGICVATISDVGDFAYGPPYASALPGSPTSGPDFHTSSTYRGRVITEAGEVTLPLSEAIHDVNRKSTPEGPYILGTSGGMAALWAYNNGDTTLPLNLLLSPFNFPSGGNVVGRILSNSLVVPAKEKIWRNSRVHEVADLVGNPTEWSQFNVKQVSPDKNLLLGDAVKNGAKHRVLLVPIEILKPVLDSAGNDTGKLRESNSLKVAQWENAFRPTALPQIKENFTNFDPDRFYIRLPKLEFSEENLPKVYITTYHANGSILDDKTEVEMEIDRSDPKMIISKSMILVADDIDDDYRGIVETGLAPEDDTKGDLSHKVELNGKLRVEVDLFGSMSSFDLKIPNNENSRHRKKTVYVHAFILKSEAGGALPLTPGDVEADFERIRSCYAQVNIDVQLVGPAVTLDPPPNVNLQNGFFSVLHGKAILDYYGSSSIDDIYLFYVNKVKRFVQNPNTGEITELPYSGVSYIEKGANPEFLHQTNNAFISSDHLLTTGNELVISAHEIGHILSNDEHYEGVNLQMNLMRDGASVSNADNAGVVPSARSKRIFDSQEQAMRGSHLAN